MAEALRAGGFAHEAKVHIRWIPSDECATPQGAARHLSDVDAICVPGGFGVRGLEGKIGALTYARTHGIPTLGLCLGLQCMVIEYARNMAGLEKADSTEFDPDSPEPVIATMEEQKWPTSRAPATSAGPCGSGSTRRRSRRAAWSARPTARTRSRSGTGTATRSTTSTATSSRRPAWCSPAPTPDNNLVEFVELPRDVHPYYVATQAHPELRSRPTRPHPLFAGLVGAAIERQKELRFPIESRAGRGRRRRRSGAPCSPASSPWPGSSGPVSRQQREQGLRTRGSTPVRLRRGAGPVRPVVGAGDRRHGLHQAQGGEHPLVCSVVTTSR